MPHGVEETNSVKQEQLEGVVQKFRKNIEKVKQRLIKEQLVVGMGRTRSRYSRWTLM
jgi:hypothetical protein